MSNNICWFHSHKCLDWAQLIYSDRKQIIICLIWEYGRGGLIAKGHEETFWRDRNDLYYDCDDNMNGYYVSKSLKLFWNGYLSVYCMYVPD